MERKTIVLGADAGYKRQILATIKSICYHNENIKFYLINKDIEEDWIFEVNRELKEIGSELVDLKIESSDIEGFKTYSHISYATYFRYFIPEKISESRVMYLDSDLIVNGSLDEFYNLDFEDNSLAGVVDMICYHYDKNTTEFNAGVMLIDNDAWRNERVLEKAIKIHLEKDSELKSADQTVLNMIFENRWKKIDISNNFQVGVNYIKKIEKDTDYFKSEVVPLIVHYTTANKPWKKAKVGLKGRFRLRNILNMKELLTGELENDYDDLWNFYDSLTFEKIKNK